MALRSFGSIYRQFTREAIGGELASVRLVVQKLRFIPPFEARYAILDDEVENMEAKVLVVGVGHEASL